MGVGNRNLNSRRDDKLVQHAMPAARPSVPTDGVDISSWKTNSAYSPAGAMVIVDGSAAATVNSPTGGASGVEIWGYVGGAVAQWSRIGYLNDGTGVDIMSNTQSYSQQIAEVGVFDRLCVCGTPSAGACTVQYIPIEMWS